MTKITRLPRFAMDNLQFFSDNPVGGDTGGGFEVDPVDVPTSEEVQDTQQPINPLLDPNFGQEPQPNLESEPQAVEELDFAGRKVPVVDPVIKDIHSDYMNVTRAYQDTNQRLLQYEEQNKQLMQLLQQQQQTQQPVQQEPQQPQVDPEEWMSKFYDNPVDSIQGIVQQTIQSALQQELAPLQQVQEYVAGLQQREQMTEEIQRLNQQYPDFAEYGNDIQSLLGENPNLPLEHAYFAAKGMRSQQQPSIEQLLQDPQFVQQNILGNQQIRDQFLSNYVQQKQQSQKQNPPLMGTQQGYQAPAKQGDTPKTFSQASGMISQWLTKQN